jgi:hypothetical protein
LTGNPKEEFIQRRRPVMDEEEIRELEPKYMGNTRHLTEGEAAEITHDPANGENEDEGFFSRAAGALFFLNRGNGSGNNGSE